MNASLNGGYANLKYADSGKKIGQALFNMPGPLPAGYTPIPVVNFANYTGQNLDPPTIQQVWGGFEANNTQLRIFVWSPEEPNSGQTVTVYWHIVWIKD